MKINEITEGILDTLKKAGAAMVKGATGMTDLSLTGSGPSNREREEIFVKKYLADVSRKLNSAISVGKVSSDPAAVIPPPSAPPPGPTPHAYDEPTGVFTSGIDGSRYKRVKVKKGLVYWDKLDDAGNPIPGKRIYQNNINFKRLEAEKNKITAGPLITLESTGADQMPIFQFVEIHALNYLYGRSTPPDTDPNVVKIKQLSAQVQSTYARDKGIKALTNIGKIMFAVALTRQSSY